MKNRPARTPEEQATKDAALDANARRREEVIRRACRVMNWEYTSAPVWAALRKVAVAEAVAVSVEKLTEMLDRLESKS